MTNTKCDDRDWAKQLFFPNTIKLDVFHISKGVCVCVKFLHSLTGSVGDKTVQRFTLQ